MECNHEMKSSHTACMFGCWLISVYCLSDNIFVESVLFIHDGV